MSLSEWTAPAGESGTRLSVVVVPGASRNQIVGLHGDALRIRVAAPPEGGKANIAVRELIATALDLRPREVELAAGVASRRKSLVIATLSPAEVRRRLGF